MDNDIAATTLAVVVLWTCFLMATGYIGYAMATYRWHVWIWRKLTGKGENEGKNN